jgi:hypothetical protein
MPTLRHVVRVLGLRRSSLRRRVDVVNAWLTLFMAVLAILAPIAAVRAGAAYYQHGLHEMRLAQQGKTRVQAVLLEDTPAAVGPASLSEQTQVLARWQGPGGSVHIEKIFIVGGGQAGDKAPIWVDSAGNAVAAPLERQQVLSNSSAVGASSLLGIETALGLALFGVRRMVDRRRLAHWQLSWASIEPQWSRRR